MVLLNKVRVQPFYVSNNFKTHRRLGGLKGVLENESKFTENVFHRSAVYHEGLQTFIWWNESNAWYPSIVIEPSSECALPADSSVGIFLPLVRRTKAQGEPGHLDPL